MFTKPMLMAVAIVVAINSGAFAAQKQTVTRGLFGNPHTIVECGPAAAWDAYALRCDGGN